MESKTRVIIGVSHAVLSFADDKVYYGDPAIAKAAYGYFSQHRHQQNVKVLSPSKIKRGFSSRRCPKNQKIFGFEIADTENLMRWWNNGS